MSRAVKRRTAHSVPGSSDPGETSHQTSKGRHAASTYSRGWMMVNMWRNATYRSVVAGVGESKSKPRPDHLVEGFKVMGRLPHRKGNSRTVLAALFRSRDRDGNHRNQD